MEGQQRSRGESGSKTGETRKTLSLVCWQPVKLTNRKKGKKCTTLYMYVYSLICSYAQGCTLNTLTPALPSSNNITP